MSLPSEKIKSGLESLKPFSLLIAGVGVYLLYQNGTSLTPFSWTVAGGYMRRSVYIWKKRNEIL